MTFPTFLSCLRIVLAFIIMLLMTLPGHIPKCWALACFAIASLTDWLDGYWARRFKQTSALGALLDPIADKILVIGIFSVGALLRLVPVWMVLVIAGREILITWIRLVAASKQIVLAAASEGKQKMVSQIIALAALILMLIIQDWPNGRLPQAATLWAWHFTRLALWAAVIFTVISGSLFFSRHRAVLSRLVSSK